eukprot:762872-Hanusia_phi.AAC.4
MRADVGRCLDVSRCLTPGEACKDHRRGARDPEVTREGDQSRATPSGREKHAGGKASRKGEGEEPEEPYFLRGERRAA